MNTHRPALKVLTVLFYLPFLAACSDGLPKYVLLGDLRILALQAAPPETTPGSSVTITPWLSDIAKGGRALTTTATACVDPGIGYGAQPTCQGRPDAVVLAGGSGAVTLAGPDFTASAASFSVSIPSSILQNRAPFEQYNGVAYLIEYTVTAADGTTVKSIKRIIVSTRPTQNSNPVLNQILANESPLAARPTAPVPLKADYPTSGATGAENYLTMATDGSFKQNTETLVTTWFISDGTLQYERTDGSTSTQYSPASPLPSGHFQVIGVLRDGRGGEDIKKLSVP
jgi:hypothetical protein